MGRHRKDRRDIAADIQQSIEESRTGSRKITDHILRDKFGYAAWTVDRKKYMTRLLEERGIRIEPPLAEAKLNQRITLSMPVLAVPDNSGPGPRPSEAWFEHLISLRFDSEREVELHFASPLFHALGYTDDQEAAGFRFPRYEGVNRKNTEADLVYFKDRHHSSKGMSLILVEVKGSDQSLRAGEGQARDYSFWLKPAYYVTTNGDAIVVYDYQGGQIPDPRVLEFKRSELSERFDDLYQILNPTAAASAQQATIDRLGGSPTR